MRTNIDLDDDLVAKGMRAFKCRTKKDLVHLALRELLRAERRRAVLGLRGKVHWEGDLDALRSGRA